MSEDEKFMQRALQLAQLGEGFVSPNPMVGAVVVYEGMIIGEGYHEEFGKHHAEVNAINSVQNKDLLSKSTIYVTLEPCAHFGKTPPCSDLIIQYQLKRVVVGCQDPFNEVNGKGIDKIKKAGITVDKNILEVECRELNKSFFTFHEKKKPFVLLKWAQTKNGFISNNDTQGITWISQPEVQSLVHLWRSKVDAILIGKNTAQKDNPSLTVRRVQGKNPTRILLDSNLECSKKLQIFNTEAKTIILNLHKNTIEGNIHYIKMKTLSSSETLSTLYSLGIQSVLIEGGSAILTSFIESDLWDEARVITSEKEFKSGVKAPLITNSNKTSINIFSDKLTTYKNI